MKNNISLVLFFLSVRYCAAAQNYLPLDSASNVYYHGNYKLGLVLYKEELKKLPIAKKTVGQNIFLKGFYMKLLGDTYLKMDSLTQAKEILEQLMKLETDASMQEQCRTELADLYFKEKDYRKAIYYYAMHDGAWSHAHFDDVNQFEVNYYRAIALSKCYEGLNFKDSAIVVLTPYVFSSYRQLGYLFKWVREPVNIKDSLKHDSVCMRYLTLLKQRYSNSNIKNELKKAEASYEYIEETKATKSDSVYFDKSLICKTQFYGLNITVAEGSVFLKRSDLELKKNYFFTKEQMLQRFRDLPLYKMITAL